MFTDTGTICRLIDAARRRGDAALVGAEAMAIARAIGIRCPESLPIRDADHAATADIGRFGDRVVVKGISARIVHKSDVGAVTVVANQRELVVAAVQEMARRLEQYAPTTFLISEYVPHDRAFAGELIVGARWTVDFGPVVTVGPGGVSAEFIAANLRPDRNVAFVSPVLPMRRPLDELLRDSAAVELATGTFRGQPARLPLADLEALVTRVGALAERFADLGIAEFEINPLVVSDGQLVALDARVIVGRDVPAAVPRPIEKLRHLLAPDRVAIVGVSADMNPGRIILHNLLREGFDPARVIVVKPGVERIEGCRCVPSLAALPEPVDLLVLSVPAPLAATLAVEAIQSQSAESLIIIPGGFEEKSGGAGLAAGVQAALERARQTPGLGPVINGGNCVGIRSKPGRYDTMFIPEDRLPPEPGPVAPIAMIAQSGAFVLSTLGKLPRINPKYVITVGNQIDLTIGDYLRYFKSDFDLDLFAVYVEGFKPHDGTAFMEAASEIVAGGRTVILYRGGRTAAGVRATSSHTAAMAGEYDVMRALARQAGVIVADTLSDFEDLIKLFALLRDRDVGGWQLAAMSNAGFECVAYADNLGAFRLAPLTGRTIGRLRTLFKLSRADALVDVQNPLDLTPMMGDLSYDEVVRAVLADETVDVGVIGCVPMTPSLNTLPLRPARGDAAFGADSIVTRLAAINEETRKAWIGIVDAGALYDPMVSRLEAAGIATFRTADRALKLFEIFCAERLRHAVARHRERSLDPFGMPDERAHESIATS
jgi:acyl-CoA synthetase (NDP forming)